MKFFRVIQRRFVSLAFGGQDVEDDGHFAGLGIFQRTDQQRQIMSVNRPQITQPHFLKNQAAAVTAASVGIHLRGVLFQRHFVEDAFESFLRFVAQLDGQIRLWASA